MQSPGFSKFRELMDVWDEYLVENEIDSRVNELIAPFVFFFKKENDIYGAGEDSRVVFAKMKHPDNDLPSGWKEEANFTAHNLKKSVGGEPSQNVFGSKDLKKIKILDKDKVSELLHKEVEKLGEKAFPKEKKTFNLIDLSRFLKRDPDDAPNFTRADEE
jgi:uncharacterized protein YozE (UPF0346 family)